ncbi:hypothetical protein HETIRDRAFT_426780 [Heterobasidion irregulare TC 32-1]|uniref:Uncharacterized protein n=1 Tax=Heterobasidion irregulare (strain TC 32-1) TaxID=747525 RepID=W4K7K0_HETIT|nr:uncharacterized protein HETIRDRAFT_426780 [Heterobasidion irregulare TC 32-1]ETW81315.1 hypothetical protein HETIRDRAFT_426780 [Heterobasidion irregulare TC 32-1]
MSTLSKAQHEGVHWILSAFRTSPIGGMEVLAGIPPLHLHIKKLVQRAALCTLRLLNQHPINTALHLQHPHEHSPHIPFPLHCTRASSNLPIQLIRDLIPKNTKSFAPLHPEVQPGKRVIDTFADHITFRLLHPPKSSPEFPAWVRDLKRRIAAESSSNNTTTCFSDGSFSPYNGRHAGCACLVLPPNSDPPIIRKLAYGQTTAFNAEVMGLTIALHHAILTPNTFNIILYADNEAALKSLLDPRVHPSQMCSILACQRLRAWLSATLNRHLTIAWCPGHVGIPRQEQKAYTSMLAAWQTLMQSTKYSGRDFPRQRAFQKVASTKSKVLRQVGQHNTLAARTVRLILNHGPMVPRDTNMQAHTILVHSLPAPAGLHGHKILILS